MNFTHHDQTLDGTWIRISLTGARTGDLCLAGDTNTALARLHQLTDQTSPD